jgi:hypothetical protein
MNCEGSELWQLIMNRTAAARTGNTGNTGNTQWVMNGATFALGFNAFIHGYYLFFL